MEQRRTAVSLAVALMLGACLPAPAAPAVWVDGLQVRSGLPLAGPASEIRLRNGGDQTLRAGALVIAPGAEALVPTPDGRLLLALADLPQARRTIQLDAPLAELVGPTVPALAPLDARGERSFQVRVVDRTVRIGTSEREGWLYDGNWGGPVLRVRAGDRVRIELENHSRLTHSLDTHMDGMGGKPQIASGTHGIAGSFQVPPMRAGVHYYHCETPPTRLHERAGMFGALLVEPAEGLPPVEQEIALIGSVLVGEHGQAVAVAINGTADGYVDRPIGLRAGSRVRLALLNAAEQHSSTLRFTGLVLEPVGDSPPVQQDAQGSTVRLGPTRGGLYEITVPSRPGRLLFYETDSQLSGLGGLGLFEVGAR